MRLLILDTTKQQTSLYGRAILDKIFEEHGSDIVAIATSSSSPSRKTSYTQRIKSTYKREKSLIYINYFYKLISIITRKKRSWKYTEVESTYDLQSRYKVPVITFNRINSTELRDFIIENNCDVVFHSGGLILKPIILNAPKIGVVGYHHGDIHKYRGPFQCFWELYNNEKQVGVTLQILKSELDTGPIILLENYPIPGKTKLKALQKMVNWESISLGAQAITKLKDKDFSPIINYQLGKYRSYPSLKQVLPLIFKGKI